MKSYQQWVESYDDHFPAGPAKEYLSKDDRHPHGHEGYYKSMGQHDQNKFINDVNAVVPMLKNAAAYLRENSDNYQYQAHVLSAALGKLTGAYQGR